MDYSWLKAFHVAAVLMFVGGLVAQTIAVANLDRATRPALAAVERWDKRVTMPAMLATWLLGVVIAVQGDFFSSGWLMAKLAIVVALSGLHGVQSGRLRRAVSGSPAGAHEMPQRAPILVFLGLAAIATLAVAKPF